MWISYSSTPCYHCFVSKDFNDYTFLGFPLPLSTEYFICCSVCYAKLVDYLACAYPVELLLNCALVLCPCLLYIPCVLIKDYFIAVTVPIVHLSPSL